MNENQPTRENLILEPKNKINRGEFIFRLFNFFNRSLVCFEKLFAPWP